METVGNYLLYFAELLLLTLGSVTVCGVVSYLTERLFVRMTDSTAMLYISSVVGTPIHELGHALMCLLFGHRITEMRLLLPPNHSSGTLGYVAHSYNPRNPWAVLGNLFIGVGPIFSGLGVIVLALLLAFPAEWQAYVTLSGMESVGNGTVWDIVKAVFSLLFSMPKAFFTERWWAALIGMVVILFVVRHVTLSWADIRGALTALPLYALLLAVFALVTMLLGVRTVILNALGRFNMVLLALFALVIAFSFMWVVIALPVWLFRLIRKPR